MTNNQFNIDYHRLLGVNRSADEQTILRAFRKLSLQHHPDKGGQEEMMKLLTMAKVTLLDPEKKAKYEANYEPDDDPSGLSADLRRLTVGHRLSDDYKVKIEQWKQEFQRIHINGNVSVLDELMGKLRQTMFSTTTVFDLGADQLINQGKSEEVMLKELKLLFQAQDFANLAQYISTHQCRTALTKLYDGVKPTHGYELPDRQKALLQIIKASSSIVFNNQNPQQDRIKGLYDAALNYPTAECTESVLKLINNRLTDAHKQEFLDTIIAHNMLDENAENKKFMQRLKITPTLKSILKFENGIHKKTNDPMEKAMLCIDLCMVYGHPIVLANTLVWAAKELIEHMTNSTDAAEVYALKNCVSDLCGTVLYFASKYANPIAQLKYATHVFRLMYKANYILLDSIDEQHSNEDIEEKPLIGEHEKALFETAIHCVSKCFKVSPIIDTSLDMTSDVLYINLVNNKLLQKYYQWNIDTYADHPSVHLYQYVLMEGSWKGWFDETKFAEYRQKCSRAMLSKFNTTEESVAEIMNAQVSNIIPKQIDGNEYVDTIESMPMIARCEEGWLVLGENYLNMGKMSFNSVDGLVVDMEHGTFQILVSTDKNIGPLCDAQDIDEAIIKGLSHSAFSLDQADYELNYHPFQLMRFAPKRLENSRYLATLLAADYLLKMIATNTEVSAQPPFEIKRATDGFLKAMPTDLREFIMMKKEKTDFNKVHRFWIENGEIPYHKSVDGNDKRTYEFYYTPMMVKKNLMKQNAQGELVDDLDDSEDDLTDDDSEDEGKAESDSPRKKISPEARFARRFTQYYDMIGCHFPVLLRLRELAKLNATSRILRNILEQRSRLTQLRDDVQEMLEGLRRQITYPICTAAKIDERYWEILHADNVYDEDRVVLSERIRVKNDIESKLKDAEGDLLKQITKLLSEAVKMANTQALYDKVCNWLAHGQQIELVDYLTNSNANQIEKLSRFGKKLNALGVNIDAEVDYQLNEGESGCKWVPATFSQFEGRRVYGGVALLPKLKPQSSKGFQGFQANAVKMESIRVNDSYFGTPGTSGKTPQNNIVTFGPSDWAPVHNPRHNTKKAAESKASRELNEKSINFIKGFEQWRSCAYDNDGAKKLTIGYGHKIIPGDGFNKDSCITKEEGLKLFQSDLSEAINRIEKNVKVKLTDNQFGALVSWSFNSGGSKSSTLIKKLNAGGQADEICNELRQWNKVKVKVNGEKKKKVSPGLIRRREGECTLYNDKDDN